MIIDDAQAPVNYRIVTRHIIACKNRTSGYKGILGYFPGSSPDNGALVGSCLFSHHLLKISS